MKSKLSSKIFLTCLMLAALLLPAFSQAAVQKTMTWDDYFDWLPWAKTNLSVVNAALQLQGSGSGYATSGSATYQYTPGNGDVSWKNVSYVESSVSTVLGTGTGSLKIWFSSNGSSWFSRDDLNAGKVPDSENLFLKAEFTGSGDYTPVLNSIALSYLSKQDARVLLSKVTYKGSATFANLSSTFVPGDSVITRITIDPMALNGLNLHIRDYRPSGVMVEQIKTASDCGLSGSQVLLTAADTDFAANANSNYTEWSNVKPQGSSGTGYLCYKYTVNDSEQAKNSLVQAKVQAFDQFSYNPNLAYNDLMATYSSYLLVKGFAIADSSSQALEPQELFPIDDVLSLARTVASYTASTGQILHLDYSPSYIYKIGQGSKSRGGQLLNLPVRMQDESGQVVASDSSYILYNPAYYLFGNLFSGSSVSQNLDMSSRGNATTRENYASAADKLNSEATLYNYNFDQNSILYWDQSNADKNSKMQQNISELISDPKPDIVCSISAADLNSANNANLFLNNDKCNIGSSTQNNIWPNGRVWYVKASGDINLQSTFHGRGTIIVDYKGGTPGTVRISTTENNFQDNAFLGLIVINGGKVLFTNNCQKFNGMIFAPGD